MNACSHLDSTARLRTATCFQFAHTARSHPSEIEPWAILLDMPLDQPRSYQFDYQHSDIQIWFIQSAKTYMIENLNTKQNIYWPCFEQCWIYFTFFFQYTHQNIPAFCL
ncbi:hypothetical protein BsWGS_09456 [Bradybaena similaris]